MYVQPTSKHISVILEGLGPQVDWQEVGSQEASQEDRFLPSLSVVAI